MTVCLFVALFAVFSSPFFAMIGNACSNIAKFRTWTAGVARTLKSPSVSGSAVSILYRHMVNTLRTRLYLGVRPLLLTACCCGCARRAAGDCTMLPCGPHFPQHAPLLHSKYTYMALCPPICCCYLFQSYIRSSLSFCFLLSLFIVLLLVVFATDLSRSTLSVAFLSYRPTCKYNKSHHADATIGDTFMRNSARLAEVWMDDYKRFFFETSPEGARCSWFTCTALICTVS